MEPEILRDRDLYNTKERRGLLNWSQAHHYRLKKAGKLPPEDFQMGGMKGWRRQTIMDFIEQRTTTAA